MILDNPEDNKQYTKEEQINWLNILSKQMKVDCKIFSYRIKNEYRLK